MKNEQEKIIHFDLSKPEVSLTYGYNISNSFPVHFHSTYNLGIVELGAREFTYRGKTTALKQNDIFIVQPFEPHNCRTVDGSGHSYKVMSFSLDVSYYFPELIITAPYLINKIKEFHALAEYEKSSGRLLAIYDDIIMQLKTYALGDNIANSDEDVSSNIQLAKQFIEKNCQHEISLKEMADISCLSEFHFDRYFHKCYGLSPYAYYLVCKMKKSQNVLVKQNSVTEAAYDIGLFDQSHFTKLFKKHIGVTPGRYLKDNKKYEEK
jgi:AraC-like DNA-binding protein